MAIALLLRRTEHAEYLAMITVDCVKLEISEGTAEASFERERRGTSGSEVP